MKSYVFLISDMDRVATTTEGGDRDETTGWISPLEAKRVEESGGLYEFLMKFLFNKNLNLYFFEPPKTNKKHESTATKVAHF